MIALSRLFVHPVKSMRGLQLSQSFAGLSGLSFDRILMVSEPDGTFITARQSPQLVLFTTALTHEGISLRAPDGDYLHIRFDEFAAPTHPTEVWGNHFQAGIAPEHVNHWLSHYLQRPVQLRWQGWALSRRVKRHPDIPLGFADGYPFLLINEASFEDLRQRCPAGIRLEQFRPNLVVSGAAAYAEDSWKTLRIGEVIFDVVKPCSRCILTTVSPERGRHHPTSEPLATLQGYRTADNGDVDFGLNLIARNQGILRAGDNVDILATHPPRPYRAGRRVETLAPPPMAENSVEIDFQGKRFQGDNQQILLEQLEQQGIRVPYSCRAGLCGCCKLTLLDGEVAELKSGAKREDGTLLACSCVPLGNLRLA
ncbi:YcbX family protein [Musicola paradisiaca]|uniref:MOSC domain containing protein n=1 Tax=Musicola paradisiaca (strain Ech703) TaxID=579405 RepID=C6C3V0_MUSP7|nr:YcbX family protein [Musicola paradisiaca]ACS85445.1 MOSC domain containing protein [Musicola paradisiaca Ech703]